MLTSLYGEHMTDILIGQKKYIESLYIEIKIKFHAWLEYTNY